MGKTKIEWTDRTWNTQIGCHKVSAGCKFCYAEAWALRLKKEGNLKYKAGFGFKLLGRKAIEAPLRWQKREQMVFLNSMSDTFHPEVTEPHIRLTFEVMNQTPWCIYQVLTKRPERIPGMTTRCNWSDNIWMGTSIENNDLRISYRLDALKKTDARIKFLSLEPLIGPLPNLDLDGIDWVIVGGESGKTPRQMRKEWVEDIQRQCAASGTAFFFKQWGHPKYNPAGTSDPTMYGGHPKYAKGGCQLNGQVFQEWPDVPARPKERKPLPLF